MSNDSVTKVIPVIFAFSLIFCIDSDDFILWEQYVKQYLIVSQRTRL